MPGKPLVLVLNGPNLNMLGVREPHLYGTETLDDLRGRCQRTADTLELGLDFRQSNHEGVLIDWVHEARGSHAGIIINAGAYTHTSIALFDALTLVGVPVIEVHLSNIFRREPFRHHSTISAAARGVICGLGPHGYVLALDAMARILKPD